MAWPTTFGGLAGGNQPLSLFDVMFAQVASMIAIPCTAAGSNAIVLTPVTNAPTLTSYGNFNAFMFQAVGTSSGAVTVQFGSLAALPVYKSDGLTQATANDLLGGQLYTCIFAQSLNSGGGGMYLVSPPVSPAVASAGGSFANLKIVNDGGFPDSRVDISCDEVVMVNASGAALRAASVGVVVNFLTTGANGLDTGSFTASGWYYLYLISNGSTTAGLASRSPTAPTMPTGYTYKKRVGAAPADLGSGQSSAVTITNATPGVVSWTAHGLPAEAPVSFTAGSGVLPAQITAGVQYYVGNTGLGANSFTVSIAPGGASINTTGGSGTVNAAGGPLRLKRFTQYGRVGQYAVSTAATSTAQLPNVANGATTPLGTYSSTSPTWQALLVVGGPVPGTASQIDLVASTNYTNATSGDLQVAPNNAYGGFANSIGSVPFFDTGTAAPTFLTTVRIGPMTLESTSIFWAATTAGCALSCAGWVDNI